MLTVETIGRVRREHFLKGKAIKEIARNLKVSRNTVRKILRSGETAFTYVAKCSHGRSLGHGYRFSMSCWRPMRPSRRASN